MKKNRQTTWCSFTFRADDDDDDDTVDNIPQTNTSVAQNRYMANFTQPSIRLQEETKNQKKNELHHVTSNTDKLVIILAKNHPESESKEQEKSAQN